MDGNEILLLGLEIQSPWKLMNQHLDTSKQPHELHLEVKAERGSKYACPECGQLCKGLGKNRLPQFCNRIDCDKP